MGQKAHSNLHHTPGDRRSQCPSDGAGEMIGVASIPLRISSSRFAAASSVINPIERFALPASFAPGVFMISILKK